MSVAAEGNAMVWKLSGSERLSSGCEAIGATMQDKLLVSGNCLCQMGRDKAGLRLTGAMPSCHIRSSYCC